MSETQSRADSPLSRRRVLQAGAVAAAAGSVLGPTRWAAANPASPSAALGAAARTISLNNDWRFGSFDAGATKPGFNDSGLPRVSLPHTVTELSWRRWDPTAWEQQWIYRRRFDVAKNLSGQRLFVDFGGALTDSRVVLNGEQIGRYVGGYLPFSFEITDSVQARDNVLAVALDSRFDVNTPPNRPGESTTTVDFWQPGGLYRDVNLRAVPQAFLSDLFAKPANVLESGRRVDVDCTVDVGSGLDKSARVEVELLDNGKTVARESASVDVSKPGAHTVELQLTKLGDIKLWDVDSPRLYDVKATLYVGGRAAHVNTTRIGFRDARFTKEGFFLNGERLHLFGVNRHHFYPYAGAAVPARVERRDAEIVRNELNCNMVRCSHYPQAEAFFDACDEVGLLAFEEVAGWGLYLGDEEWKGRVERDVRDMVVRDRNHPSIVLWGARLNETFDDVELFTRTRDLAHRLDDSRQTTGAMIGGMHDTNKFVQDVFSYNDYARADGHASLLAPRSDFPYLVSEAVGTLSGPAKYYRRTAPVEDQQGQAVAHAHVHEIAASDKAYCGLLSWSGFDYPSGTGNNYEGVKYTGVVDLFRELKPGAALYQAQVDPKVRPVIQPAFYWDFGPKSPAKGPGKDAMICSNCDRLEVFVDDERVANVEPDRQRFGNLSFPPSFVDLTVDGQQLPELRIDGYVGGERVLSRRFASDPAGDVLDVRADDRRLNADGSDATRVVFRVLDRYGAARPYPKGDVDIVVKGPGELIGDNPFAFEDAGGVGAVWIRSLANNPGKVRVRVDHPRLESGSVSIDVRNTAPGGPPAANTDLDAASAPALVRPGETSTVTTQLSNHSSPDLNAVELSLATPSGWRAKSTSPTKFETVKPGQTVRGVWEVTAPSNARPGSASVLAAGTYRAAGQQDANQTMIDLNVPTTLADARQNPGISDDSDVRAADLDGAGNSYSRQALAEAGLTPGGEITHDGITFVWPDTPAGNPDNLLANAQTLSLDGSGSKIGVLGVSSGGRLGGLTTVHYADGTTSEADLRMDDWFFAPQSDNQIVARMPYLNAVNQHADNGEAGKRTHEVFVFYVAIPAQAGKKVIGVTVPQVGSSVDGHTPALHIFALGVG